MGELVIALGDPAGVSAWGDQIEYRKDIPLQNAFDATCGAQSIVFGMFGIKVELNGDISINPRPPKFSPNISFKGVKIRGTSFDIAANKNDYELKVGPKVMHSKIGVPVLLKA